MRIAPHEFGGSECYRLFCIRRVNLTQLVGGEETLRTLGHRGDQSFCVDSVPWEAVRHNGGLLGALDPAFPKLAGLL
jgi:hypothetical protein